VIRRVPLSATLLGCVLMATHSACVRHESAVGIVGGKEGGEAADAAARPSSAIVNMAFRFKGRDSLADLDPARIVEAVHGVAGVERYKVFDDRASDANFVTLVVALSDPDHARLTSLHRALTSIARVSAYTIDAKGNLTPLDQTPPERLPEVAKTDVEP
jgi:hypothetical protein